MYVKIPIPTFTSTPTPTLNPTNAQLLQLTHQINNNSLPLPNLLILGFLMNFPMPQQWFSAAQRLDMYRYLIGTPFLSSLHISPVMLIILINIFPLIGLLVIVIFIAILYSVIRSLPRLVAFLVGRFIKPEDQIFLELTFPHDTSKSAYATQELFTTLHNLGRQQGFLPGLARQKKTYSLEIVSSRDEGIRYLLVIPKKDSEGLKSNLLAFLPGIKIKESEDDYLKNELVKNKADYLRNSVGIVDLKLSADFALPLKTQKTLTEHDPISYLTSHMTKLNLGELVCLQVVVTPILSSLHENITKHESELRSRMVKGQPIMSLLQKNILQEIGELPILNIAFPIIGIFLSIVGFVIKFLLDMLYMFLDSNSKGAHPMDPTFTNKNAQNLQELLNPYEKEIQAVVKEKIDQPLFETSIRLLVVVDDQHRYQTRVSGFLSSLGLFASSHQALIIKGSFFYLPILQSFSFLRNLSIHPSQQRLLQFQRRILSSNTAFSQNPVLSASEISDIYHLPYTDTTKTEGIIKSKSKDLPAPLSQKRSDTNLDVVVGKNSYGGEQTQVGFRKEERNQHTYIVGKTGAGKSNLIKNLALQDIENGKGIALIDPHGDLVTDLLPLIPKKRIKDVVYVNLSDEQFPVGLNILVPGVKFANINNEQDWIMRSLMAIFMKITPKEHWGQRMEHILRNATLSALQIPASTPETPYTSLLTIQKLLTDRSYQKNVTPLIFDPILKQFWEKEFKMLGTMQQAGMISPVTNKLGEFFTSIPTRNILLQEKSTINIQQIMDTGKILLINLSKGELGEERSNFFGMLFTSLIQLAAYSRQAISESKRKDFYVYIDEFQNFATHYFTSIFSEARKYHVFFFAAHQNIAQIEDKDTATIVLSNSGNMIVFKNGPDDEQLLLPYLEPEVEKGEIINLPLYHFFMKVTNGDNEDAFSGETLLSDKKGSNQVAEEIISYSRKTYATPKVVVEKQLDKLFGIEKADKLAQPETERKILKPKTQNPVSKRVENNGQDEDR